MLVNIRMKFSTLRKKMYSTIKRWKVEYIIYKKLIYGGDLSTVDVSGMMNFSHLFDKECYKHAPRSFFNGIENWDMSSAVNVDYMFRNCKRLNRDVSNWKVFNLVTAEGFLEGCSIYNKRLYWDAPNLVNVNRMFKDCIELDSDLSMSKLPSVKKKVDTFRGCGKLRPSYRFI